MADLLADPVKETWRQMAANDTTVVSAPKTIDPNAQIKLAARDQAADPFAGLDEVKNDAFAGLEEVKTEDAFSGLQPADSLDVKDTQSLVDDDTFHPADYIRDNPDLRKDAEKSKKLIDVYRARRERGLEARKVIKAAVQEAPGIVAKTVKGVRDLGARIIETGIQPAATSVLATLTGASVEEKAAIMAEQGKEQLKAVGEVTAGTEAAVTGLAQLGQQGVRKLFGKSPEKMSDSELLDQLYLDSEFSKTIAEVAEGRGDAVKAAGLDADTLAKNGVILDKEAIEHLSLVDPVTLVATAGAFKVVGLGGRVLATAANRAGAQAVITGLGNLVKTVGSKSVEAAGKTAEVIGKTVQPIAERLPAKSVGFILGAAKTGTLTGGAVGAAAGEAAKRIGVETAGALSKRGARVAELGGQLNPSFIGPRSAGLSRLLSLPSTTAGKIATRTAGGAVQGAVTALPLVAAADDSQTAGALLGGGIALGAIHGVATGGKAAVAETVAKNYLDPHNIPFEKATSPGYGVDVKLDALHDAAIAKLPEHERNAVNAFREAVRAGGGEIYVQDSGSYLNRVRENLQAENGGQPLTPEQEAQAKLYADTHAFFDGMIPDANGEARRVVFLNSDSTGIHHDSGHLFQALLSPENQAALRESALSSYSKEQIQAFKDEYARRIGEPDYFDKLGDQADFKAADELIAENFGQLFQNKTFADLSAPRSFLKKLSDTAIQAGEALGFDLTAGRTTADLGAKPSFRLQDLLRNAAQDVLTREPKTPAAPVGPPKLKMVEPADVKPVLPVEAAPVKITPAEVLPKEPVSPTGEKPVVSETPPSTAKNIRAERTAQSDFAAKRAEETGIAEAQKATESDPATRKTVDAIAESMQRGNPVLEIEHLGIVSERGPAAPEGRTSRRGTQEAGYQELERLQIENRAEAPADIVDLHQKTFVPVRFTTQGGKPTLIAMSLDKVIANVRKVVGDTVANKAESLLPYPVENGKLTDAGWKQAISDVQAYSENQSNGYRGDGKPLVRPTEDIGVSLPSENPNYTPKALSEGAMNFSNLVQGLAPPETGRVQKGLTPGNIKGQLLAEINKKQPMTPAVIKPENVTKQSFKGFEPRTVKETNPLRNELAARGVKVRELLEVTERLAVKDITSVKPRADIAFKAPVTDIIRSGFLPGKETDAAVRAGFLPDTKPAEPTPSAEIRGLALSYAKGAGIEYRPSRTYGAIDPALSKRLADFYDGAQSNPSDPAVASSYKALADETMAQYKMMQDAGYTIEPFLGEGEPYKNSAEAVADIRDNKHLWFLQTDKAFGTGTEPITNPMLADSGAVINGQRLPVNDVFRAVHDFFGHGKEGYQFGPRGELNAWRAHSEMFSPEAQGALAAETLAQNSWVNFGKHLRDANGNIAKKGEANYVPPTDRPFGEQKNVVVPEDLIAAARKVAGESAKFLPENKTIAELGPEIQKMSGDEWKRFTESTGSNLTPEAFKLGMSLTDRADLALLRQFQTESMASARKVMDSGDFVAAMTENTKAQFFREAVEAATDTGSAANPRVGWRRVMPDAKPPFAGEAAKFLPASDFDKALDPVDLAAIRTPGGRIFTGSWHGDAGMKLIDAISNGTLGEKLPESVRKGFSEGDLNLGFGEDGFTTISGKFLTREQALAHAKKIKQLREDRTSTAHEREGYLESDELKKNRNFLPRTKAGKELAKKGFDFQLDENADKTQFVVRAVGKTGEDVGRLEFTVDDFGNSELKNIFVNPDQRQQGIGSTLYKEMADYLQEQEVTRNTGEIISPEAVKRRKEVLPTTTFRDSDGERLTVSEALENADNGLSVYAESYVPKTTQFLPKRRKSHDYDVSDDYEKARIEPRVKEELEAEKEIWKSANADATFEDFDVVPVKAGSLGDSIAKYVDGTSSHPVVVVDMAVHQNAAELSGRPLGELLQDTLRHELVHAVEDSKGISRSEKRAEAGDINFLPKKRKIKVSDVQKRDERGRPLTREGLVDNDKFYAELTAERKRDEAKRDADLDKRIAAGAYQMPKSAPKSGLATGWILPNQEFVPLDAAFHEQFLADNSTDLNKKFGTKFSGSADVIERLDALNKGFVRVRYIPSDGSMRVELAASNWNPKTKRAVLNQIEAQSDNIDKIYVSLLNKEGGTADFVSKNVAELEGAQKFDALSEAIGTLRGGSAKFLPKLPKRTDWGYVGDVNQDGEIRAAAVNLATTTHSAMGLESMWRYNPLTKKVYWWDTAERNAHSDLVKEELEAAGHEVVGNRMVTTDISTYNEAHANSEKYPARDYFRNTKFLPSETGTLPGLKMPSQQDRVKSRIAKAKNSFPEALPPRYEKDDAGKFVMDEDGKPKPILEDYRFDETPVAREAAKGLRGDEREEAVVSAIGSRLVKAAKSAQKNPDIAAGVTWYSTARSRLKKLLGDDSKFFSELLGATSARTPVETNFRFALDAYNEFKRGNYDAILKKYREGKDRWESGEVEGFSTRAAFMDSWVQENNLTPLQSNGKKFAMNSQAVLKVLDGSWSEEVGGPKTPNFAGNLSGQTFEATIDVWASRLIHRLANEGNEKPWRILPENETGLSDADFALGQKIFRAAARKLAMKPDALQAILWFAEKDHWEKNGWTRGAGAEKSDFNVLLKETELTPAGILKRKTPQKEFDLGLSEDDIKFKNK